MLADSPMSPMHDGALLSLKGLPVPVLVLLKDGPPGLALYLKSD